MAKKGGHLLLHIIYSLFLLFSGIATVIAASSPFWLLSAERFDGDPLLGGNKTFACGVFTDCDDRTDSECDIDPYGDEVNDIPIGAWRYSAVFFGMAMAIIWGSFLVSLLTCCFCYRCTKIQQYFLIGAALLLFSAMLAFGSGLRETRSAVGVEERVNPKVKCICGLAADNFDSDECELGTGVNLAIAATAVIFVTAVINCKLWRMDERWLHELEND